MQAIDVQAMAMALAACWVAPLGYLNRHKPSPLVCTTLRLGMLLTMVSLLQAAVTLNAVFLVHRPWYPGGNGTAHLVSCVCFW